MKHKRLDWAQLQNRAEAKALRKRIRRKIGVNPDYIDTRSGRNCPNKQPGKVWRVHWYRWHIHEMVDKIRGFKSKAHTRRAVLTKIRTMRGFLGDSVGHQTFWDPRVQNDLFAWFKKN